MPGIACFLTLFLLPLPVSKTFFRVRGRGMSRLEGFGFVEVRLTRYRHEVLSYPMTFFSKSTSCQRKRGVSIALLTKFPDFQRWDIAV
jgi:hypothetical protein